MWALAVGKKTEMLATGGTDAVVNLWHDCTAEDKQEAFRKEVSAYFPAHSVHAKGTGCYFSLFLFVNAIWTSYIMHFS